MFNLDQAIADWRRQMAARGIKSPAVLDELESHLRDEIEHQIYLGAKEQNAYLAAVDSIGRASALKAEFAKVARSDRPTASGIPPNRLFRLSSVRSPGQHLDSSGI